MRHPAGRDHRQRAGAAAAVDGDVIKVRERSKKMDIFAQVTEGGSSRRIPEWLEFNAKELTAKVIAVPDRSQIDTPVDELPVVEFYSRV